MGDRLTIRVCGADRQPIPDRFDLHVCVWSSRRVVARVRDHAGTVTVPVEPTEAYAIHVYPARHRAVSDHVIGGAARDIFCPVKPERVIDVDWPIVYAETLTRCMTEAAIDALEPLPRAGLLNLHAALVDADLWRDVLAIDAVKPDRIFAVVRADLYDALTCSPHWVPVSGLLHDAPAGFSPAGSYKQRGVSAGGLQVTLFTDGTAYRADIDLDDAAGLAHVFQVVDHYVTGTTTHPYDIHQILTFHRGIDPGYRLVV